MFTTIWNLQQHCYLEQVFATSKSITIDGGIYLINSMITAALNKYWKMIITQNNYHEYSQYHVYAHYLKTIIRYLQSVFSMYIYIRTKL